MLPLRKYTNAALALDCVVQGVTTVGGKHVGSSAGVGLLSLNSRVLPPETVTPLSKTTLPSWNVNVAPPPTLSPLLQSTHQFPGATTVVPGLQLYVEDHRWK